jgi:hypothetical protein
MAITIPFVSLLALSCIQPRSPSAQLVPVTILINLLTLEVYSSPASTTRAPGYYSELPGRFVERNLGEK